MVASDPDLSQRSQVAVVETTGPGHTDALGSRLANALEPGDRLLLTGPLGAGKSHLVRAIIRSRLGQPDADVPSPSYTIVNVYELPQASLWHADLYRLSSVDELDELGLADAPADAILLVEWGERWLPQPPRCLVLDIQPRSGDHRSIRAQAFGHGWQRLLAAFEADA